MPTACWKSVCRLDYTIDVKRTPPDIFCPSASYWRTPSTCHSPEEALGIPYSYISYNEVICTPVQQTTLTFRLRFTKPVESRYICCQLLPEEWAMRPEIGTTLSLSPNVNIIYRPTFIHAPYACTYCKHAQLSAAVYRQ